MPSFDVPVVPPSRCSNYRHDGRRCEGLAEQWLYAPNETKKIPGGGVCLECARRATSEYQDKLGEAWTALPPPPTVAYRQDFSTFYHGEYERLFPLDAETIAQVRVGDFYWFVDTRKGRRSLVIVLPDVFITGQVWTYSIWPVSHKGPSGIQWRWDGNKARPTIEQELYYVDTWRGYMRAGKLETI